MMQKLHETRITVITLRDRCACIACFYGVLYRLTIAGTCSAAPQEKRA
jgi:hypothetical protein